MHELTQAIPTPKGMVASVIHYPDQTTTKLALLCPGYLDSKDYTHLVTLARELCTLRFTVVRFDPIGTWDSEGDVADYSITQCLADIGQILAFMHSKGEYRTVLLGGHSRGGQVAIHYAARNPEVNIVLGIMPPCWPAGGKLRDRWEQGGIRHSTRDLPSDSDQTREYTVPVSYLHDRDQYNVTEDARKISVPVILIAGELDDCVTPAEVRDIYNAATEPKTLHVLNGIQHNYRFQESEIATVNQCVREQIINFT